MNPPSASSSVARRASAAYLSDSYTYSLPGGFAAGGGRARSMGSGPPVAGLDLENAPATSSASAHPAEHGRHTLVVTDSACDLPEDWLAAHGVVVMPMKLRFGERSLTDTRDEGEVTRSLRLAFLERELARIGADAQALPLSAVGAYDFVHERLREDTDFVLAVSLASHRGAAYMNSLTAAQNLMLQHGRARRQAGIQRPFKMWVIDSTTALGGQAVLVCEAVRLLREGASLPRVVQQLDALRRQVRTLLVPADAAFLHRHSRIEGEAAIGWLSYGVGKMLDRSSIFAAQGKAITAAARMRGFESAVERAFAAVTAQVGQGLAAPCVSVSYAGDCAPIRNWPAFTALEDSCVRHGVELHVATMSLTNALTTGGSGLTISLACDALPV